MNVILSIVRHWVCVNVKSMNDLFLFQANPPALLSNIQYIQGFYGNRMEGAEAYWWAQFTSAVEFIKTMLNRS